MNCKRIKMILICTMSLLLTGCGNKQELKSYEEQMSTFFTNIAELDSGMNEIDASADDAHTQLLDYLDSIETEFNHLAALEVPDEFLSVETLADEAAENMSQAVALYHQVFENETYDSTTASVADEYYARANVRLQYIISILHGEIPEGDNVTVTMEDELDHNAPAETDIPAAETHGEIETQNPLADAEGETGSIAE